MTVLVCELHLSSTPPPGVVVIGMFMGVQIHRILNAVKLFPGQVSCFFMCTFYAQVGYKGVLKMSANEWAADVLVLLIAVHFEILWRVQSILALSLQIEQTLWLRWPPWMLGSLTSCLWLFYCKKFPFYPKGGKKESWTEARFPAFWRSLGPRHMTQRGLRSSRGHLIAVSEMKWLNY